MNRTVFIWSWALALLSPPSIAEFDGGSVENIVEDSGQTSVATPVEEKPLDFSSAPLGVDSSVVIPAPTKQRSLYRGKEAEGTKALDRFKADATIRSQYHYEGKPLDVDPD